MDINELPEALMLARGRYATIRSQHEDSKQRLQILCGSIAAMSAQVLRAAQPDNHAPIDAAHITSLIAACRTALDEAERCADDIGKLAALRAELRPLAWPKNGN